MDGPGWDLSLAVRQNAGLVVLWTSFLYAGYQFTNHVQFVPPHTLPETTLDRAVPFLVWTVVPYFLLIGGMYLPILLRSSDDLHEAMAALTVAVVVNYSIFLVFPTVIARPPAPVGHTTAEILYRWLIGIDSPANCFPSGHITAPAIGCWYVSRERQRGAWMIAVAYAALVPSVLTTKQHYVYDIAGGLATATLGIVMARRWRARRRAEGGV